MNKDVLPEDVTSFIWTYIDSVEQMEVLLFLRDRQDREWDADAIGRELRSTTESVGIRLKDLCEKKFLECRPESPPLYRYALAKDKQDATLASLAEAYKVRRFSVINTIFSRPKNALRSFSEAFKIKRDEGEDT